jgi:hypothetical protein
MGEVGRLQDNPSGREYFSSFRSIAHIANQIPHAFQDILGSEKTPSLCYVIVAYASFLERWEELAGENQEWAEYIKPGLEKLEDYSLYLDDVPAYTLAMGIFLLLLHVIPKSHNFMIALDPRYKLTRYEDNRTLYQNARKLLINAVCDLNIFSLTLFNIFEGQEQSEYESCTSSSAYPWTCSTSEERNITRYIGTCSKGSKARTNSRGGG